MSRERSVQEDWPIGRNTARPETWFSKELPRKKQKDNSSCGLEIGIVFAQLISGKFVERSEAKKYIKISYGGIDPNLLTKAMYKMDIDCEEFKNAKVEALDQYLSEGKYVAILDIQAPWSDEVYCRNNFAGHYVLAYASDDKYIYFYDTGNHARFGKIEKEKLQDYWHDRMIRSGRRTFNGYMLLGEVNDVWRKDTV